MFLLWSIKVFVYVSSCLHRYIARKGGGCGGIAYIRSSLVGHVPCCSQAFQCVCGQPLAASVKISEVSVKAQDTGVGSWRRAALRRMSNMLWLCCCSRAVPILQCRKGWSCSRCLSFAAPQKLSTRSINQAIRTNPSCSWRFVLFEGCVKRSL